MSHTEPEPSVSGATKASRTKVPSRWKTWMRSLARSHAYTRPSWDTSAQCSGLRNCCAGGSSGS